MRTTSSPHSTTRTVVAAVVTAVAVTVILVVGPTALVEHALQAARALTARYGTAWVALAGVVALAVTLVRRAQPRRPVEERPVLTPELTRQIALQAMHAHRADGRPRLTLVRAEAQS